MTLALVNFAQRRTIANVRRHQNNMSYNDPSALFKGVYFGMKDKNGNDLHEGDSVRFYHKGEFVICRIIYEAEWGMFCLLWSDGYKNKHPLNPEKYERVM